MNTEVVKIQSAAALEEITVDQVMAQVQKIQALMTASMTEGEHYGTIPGTKKPTLYKAGAEKLSLMFRLAPTFEILQTDLPRDHREYRIVCSLTHINSGRFLGSGVGCCSTMESKYRYRHSERICPECGEPAITKSREDFGGGWFCWNKKGGCGAKWDAGDTLIEGQDAGKVEHGDPADYYNTALKMAKKRAMNDAVISSTAVSDCFVQADDLPPSGAEKPPPRDQPPTREKDPAPVKQRQGIEDVKEMTQGQARALDSLLQGCDSELAGKIESVLEKGTIFQNAADLIRAAQEKDR